MDAANLLIVVPARGGSKGLPRKNAKELGGIPLLGWTAEAIRDSGLKNVRAVLSTDDPQIAALGESVGLRVPFTRPSELASDEAGAVDVVLHALEWVEKNDGVTPHYVMWLQPTSPFRPPEVIHQALTIMRQPDVNAVIGVKAIHRALGTLFYRGEQGDLSPLKDQTEVVTRRQNVRSLYTPNGAMYAAKTRIVREQRTLFPTQSQSIVMDKVASHDIDDPTDWSIATALVDASMTWRR
jgi:CMP-N,N'-diacetyllegionaminic acid synthase